MNTITIPNNLHKRIAATTPESFRAVLIRMQTDHARSPDCVRILKRLKQKDMEDIYNQLVGAMKVDRPNERWMFKFSIQVSHLEPVNPTKYDEETLEFCTNVPPEEPWESMLREDTPVLCKKIAALVLTFPASSEELDRYFAA